ncbi:MAG: SDR family oxidoreductase [Firmicutes bacterium]|uniref:SDR family oxidoreductase n=1 Tax=Candidatus Gallilactobacillus intestinavium TaxID=2840838 RepID=A0A9D9E522_9LACO|nr:SDR family oxidoreductase [Candidatus Gallilactobacillus intestinavium]
MKTVFVAGATGRVGSKVVDKLLENNYRVIAGVRNPELIQTGQQLMAVHLDLHDSVAKIKQVLKNADAVICTVGSGGKDLLQTDLNGTVKLMQATELVGIKRYVQLSSAYALNQEMWDKIPALSELTDFNIAKYYSDRWLMHMSHLNYTIVQPGSLTETPGTGQIKLNPHDPGTNSIEDVADVLVSVLELPNTIKKVFMMSNGDQKISEALKLI